VVFLATTYDPNELIKKNTAMANTLASQTSQPNAGGSVGKLTGDVLNVLEPVRRQQENRINQQYNTSKEVCRRTWPQPGAIVVAIQLIR